MEIDDIRYEWRLVKSYILFGEYAKALNSTYHLMLVSFLWLFVFVIRLPFLLPAVLIMFVAKFRSSKS